MECCVEKCGVEAIVVEAATGDRFCFDHFVELDGNVGKGFEVIEEDE
jgi:hypothetical protein